MQKDLILFDFCIKKIVLNSISFVLVPKMIKVEFLELELLNA
jgi:hypothetical protein